MKILLSSDWHLRWNNPENRIDDFAKTQLNKVEQILQIAAKEDCHYILQAGDITDSPRPSFELVSEYVRLFKKYNVGNTFDGGIKILHVFGQHDMIFRSKEKTAVKLLNFLGYLEEVKGLVKLSDNVDLYGVSWGDEIPQIEDKDNFNILLIHKTILNKSLWPGQEDYLQSDKLMNQYPYDVVICGDNHHPVFYQLKEQTIIGCGSIVRKTTSEADIIPHIYILNINEEDFKYTLDKIILDHKPTEEVFKKGALAKDTRKENEKLNEFINNIKNNSMSNNMDFRKNLETLMLSIETPVKNIILKELETLHE